MQQTAQEKEDRIFAQELITGTKDHIGNCPLQLVDENSAPSFAKLAMRSGEYPLAGYVMDTISSNYAGFVYTNKRIIYCTEYRQGTGSIFYEDVSNITKTKEVLLFGECKMKINGITMPMVTSYTQMTINRYIEMTEKFVYHFKNR